MKFFTFARKLRSKNRFISSDIFSKLAKSKKRALKNSVWWPVASFDVKNRKVQSQWGKSSQTFSKSSSFSLERNVGRNKKRRPSSQNLSKLTKAELKQGIGLHMHRRLANFSKHDMDHPFTRCVRSEGGCRTDLMKAQISPLISVVSVFKKLTRDWLARFSTPSGSSQCTIAAISSEVKDKLGKMHAKNINTNILWYTKKSETISIYID